MNELIEREIRRNTVFTAVTRGEFPEQQILRQFRNHITSNMRNIYRNNMTIGILKYKVLREFCQIQSIIEEENDPIRKGEWIIAKEKTVQLYMKFWKETKQNDNYLLSENPQLRGS